MGDLGEIRVWKWDDEAGKLVELTVLADKEELVYDKYAAAFRRATVPVSTKAYRLVELREKCGPASLVTKVIDGSGNPLSDKAVTFYWPSAPKPPDPETPVYPHDWYDRFTWVSPTSMETSAQAWARGPTSSSPMASPWAALMPYGYTTATSLATSWKSWG